MQNPFTDIKGLSEKEKALGYLVAKLVFAQEADRQQLASQVANAGISPQMIDSVGNALSQCRSELNSRQPTIDDLLRTT